MSSHLAAGRQSHNAPRKPDIYNIHIYIYMYTHITYIYIYICMHIYIYIYIYLSIYIYIYFSICMYMSTRSVCVEPRRSVVARSLVLSLTSLGFDSWCC